jgi:hypothetical protein
MEASRIEDIARQLAGRLPEALGSLRSDLESNFRVVLQSQLQRLDLASRTDFDAQLKLLERARQRIEQLDARVADLETRIRDLEQEIPPVSD